jgi:alkyldihydroxyacetonephosphate synthase
MRRRAGVPDPPVEHVRPRTYEEIAELLRSGKRVVPVGGGSGVCGAVDPAPGDVLLDLSALNAILEVDEHDLIARVQAGVNGLALEEELNRRGLTLGHFPSSLPVASVGGLVATRSSGQQSTLYGNVEDMVLGLKVMLPDGSTVEPRAPVRSAVGPPLHELFIGSEGALGVILEVVVGLSRLPALTRGDAFDFGSLDQGLEATREIIQAGLAPLVMRLYDPDDTAFQGSEANGCLLVLGFAGGPAVAEAQMDAALAICRAGDGRPLGVAAFDRWRDRRFHLSAERLRASLEPPGAFVDTIEVAARWSVLPSLHRRVKDVIGAHGAGLCHFSHAYRQGCCAYFTFAGSADSEAAAEAAYAACWEGTMLAALELGATIGHHHGTGQARAPWVRRELDGWWQVWRKVRSAFDPAGVMNPNAVGGPEPPA